MLKHQKPASRATIMQGMTCLKQAKDVFNNTLSLNPILSEKTPVFKSCRVRADFSRIPTKRGDSDKASELAEFMGWTRMSLNWWPDNSLDSLQPNFLSLDPSYTAVSNVQLHQRSFCFCSSIIKINQEVQPAVLSVLAGAGLHAHLGYTRLYTNNKLVFKSFC